MTELTENAVRSRHEQMWHSNTTVGAEFWQDCRTLICLEARAKLLEEECVCPQCGDSHRCARA